MRLAIPEFKGRVSPVFDCCRRLLVIDTLKKGPDRIASVDWSELECVKRPARLREMGIKILLCGGISTRLAREIEAGGVYIVPWISGEVGEIIDAYFNGRLPDPQLTMPGCRRGRFGGQGRDRLDLPGVNRGRGRRKTGSGWR
jgi:predicted Fe-Mo cluster-binding NifX family protein